MPPCTAAGEYNRNEDMCEGFVEKNTLCLYASLGVAGEPSASSGNCHELRYLLFSSAKRGVDTAFCGARSLNAELSSSDATTISYS